MVDMEKANHPITSLCAALGVSRAGYYEWCRRGPCKRSRDNDGLMVHIRSIHAENKQRYGSPRITKELKARGQKANHKRVERLMRENDIVACAPKKFRRTTDSKHKHPIAPNLIARNFHVPGPNQVWVVDITYVWTLEGWVSPPPVSPL